MNVKTKNKNIDLFLAIFLGVLSITIFLLQVIVLKGGPTPLNMSLFNLIQFIFTCSFGWFTNKYIIESDIEKNIKKFAISSYRRILTVAKMINKLQNDISQVEKNDNPNELNMKNLKARIEDTALVLHSSIDDWVDVIGDELLALENMKTLIKEKEEIISKTTQLDSDFDFDDRLLQIESKISDIYNKLPNELKFSSEYLSGQDTFNDCCKSLIINHNTNNGLILEAIAGGNYSHKPISSEELSEKTFYLNLSEIGSLNLIDCDNNIIGRVLSIHPFSYNIMLESIKYLYGKVDVCLKYEDVIKSKQISDNKFTHFKVKIIEELKSKNS